MQNQDSLLKTALEMNLFDAEWYRVNYSLSFATDQDAFADYLRKSKFANVSPSPSFSSTSYLNTHKDVYVSGQDPLSHYLTKGLSENRSIQPHHLDWSPRATLSPSLGTPPDNGRYAVVLHIFYEDFIERFYSALYGVDFQFDLFITSTEQSVLSACQNRFSSHPQVSKIYFKAVPNRGRNFGPFLVEFGKVLQDYDYFLHLHSKKSLYSGREQTQWASYLTEYLVKDKHILAQGLNILRTNPNLGLYYPTPFWNLPPWVNHWLKNKGLGRHLLTTWFGIEQTEDFFAYPVGGMFWAKTDALRPLLEREWTYDDFPDEPLPADGTILHVLERILPELAAASGYDQFFYDPGSGKFTTDDSYIYKSYYNTNERDLYHACFNKDIISFDIFDTVVKRDYYEPDLAKYLLPDRAGLSIKPQEFIKLRNETEVSIRRERDFIGDVTLSEVYDRMVPQLTDPADPHQLENLEFELDLELLSGKPSIVSLINSLANAGKEIYFISDTYYSRDQIDKLIKKSGVNCEYRLFVSSELSLRKDTGAMWSMMAKHLEENHLTHRFIHIGDSVTSDAQNSGDFGLESFHILNPLDKWRAINAPDVLQNFKIEYPHEVAKWGPIIAKAGCNPFIH